MIDKNVLNDSLCVDYTSKNNFLIFLNYETQFVRSSVNVSKNDKMSQHGIDHEKERGKDFWK